jgi:hypothetical protein
MSSRTKRKLEHFDPNASDPDDHDWDASERPSPQRRRKRQASGAPRKKGSKRRLGYAGSDVDDDDEIVSDDSFTERSSSEEVEINPTTGRSVRRATKKQIKYEESEEDEIQDTPSESDSPAPRRRNKAHQSIEKPSLLIKLRIGEQAASQLEGNMSSGRNLRTRQGSKSLAHARGETPNPHGTRRSNRLSHDVEEPIVALSDSGRHATIVRKGTRSPEPMPARPHRGAKAPRTSAVIEASQEDSMVQPDDSPGPIDDLLAEDAENAETQVQGSPEHEAQATNEDAEGEEDEEMQIGVIQESQHDPLAAEDSDEEEGPVTRGARGLRVSFPAESICLSTRY